MTDESDKTKKAEESIENNPLVKQILETSFKKDMADSKLKEEISELIKSGTSENKILALEKIENCGVSFPNNFERPIFTQLLKDPDERVKTKANEVFYKKFGSAFKGISMPFVDLGKFYEGTFSKIAADLAITSTAFTQMQEIAKITRNSLDIPICAIDLGINWDLVNQSNLFKDFQGFQIQFPNLSPILTTTEIIAPILDWNNQKLTIPQALGRSESEVEYELDTAIRSNTDVIFNFEGYPFLYNLERLIRNLVRARICEKYRSRINEKIPLEILEEWKNRRNTEKENPFVEGDYDLIEYSDFSHLKIIIEKRNNKKDFLDIFNDQELTGIINKLNELDPIRKKIAHSRSLTENEFIRLKMYAEDIARIMQKYSEYS